VDVRREAQEARSRREDGLRELAHLDPTLDASG
jgi:hypothetical protein